MLIDEAAEGGEEGPRGRSAARKLIDEHLERPFDPTAAARFDKDLWARKNLEAMQSAGMGAPDDPFLASQSDEELERLEREELERQAAAGETAP